jgi:hypothetical protein
MMKSRRMRWAGHVARMGLKRKEYMILMGQPEGKRHSRRLEDNIKIDLRNIRWVGMEWIDLALERDRRKTLGNTVMNLQVP